jgi:hypothetical protein
MPEEDKAAAMSPTAWMDARLQIQVLILDLPSILLNTEGVENPFIKRTRVISACAGHRWQIP